MVPGDIKVSEGGSRALQALAAAATGSLTCDECAHLIPTDPGQGFSRIAYRLQRDGLVELSDWNGHKYREIALTQLGHDVCATRGWS